jgi:hypothetical protein
MPQAGRKNLSVLSVVSHAAVRLDENGPSDAAALRKTLSGPAPRR